MPDLKRRLEDLADRGTVQGGRLVWQRAQQQLDSPHGWKPTTPSHERFARRTWLVAAVSVTVILATSVLGYLAVGRETGTGGVSAGTASNAVVIGGGNGLSTLVDLSTGTSHGVTFAGKIGGDFSYDVYTAGGFFVYQGSQGPLALPVTMDRSAHLIGRATFSLPSTRAGRVWLITAQHRGFPLVAQEVGVDGRYHGRRYQLPGSQGVSAAANGGLILGSYIWYPATNITRPLPAPVAGAVDVHGSLLAASTRPTIELFDVATGKLRTYPVPTGVAAWVLTKGESSHGAFSPDGQRLALRATLASNPSLSSVQILDLATGVAVVVPHSQARAFSPVTWTPDGKTVLFEGDTATLGTYQLASGISESLPQPCCGTLVAVSK